MGFSKLCRFGLSVLKNLRFQEEHHARRSILSATERESLLALPDTQDELIRRYTLSDSDLSIVRQLLEAWF